MRTERAKLSKHASVAGPMDYMLKRWEAFARFLEDGRICLTNNAAERALRGIAMLESLCGPFSSVCKHWKRVLIGDTTRAALSGNRSFDGIGLEIRCPDLVGRARHDLRGGKDLGLDETPNGVAGHA